MIGRFRRLEARQTGRMVGNSIETLRIDGETSRALETGRNRLLVTGALFVVAFLVIAGRLVEVTLLKGGSAMAAHAVKTNDLGIERADVVDRDGVLLATSLPTMSLYARPREIADKPEAARRVAALLTDMSASEILAKMQENRAFIYLRRNLTPRQEYDINRLGIPVSISKKAKSGSIRKVS